MVIKDIRRPNGPPNSTNNMTEHTTEYVLSIFKIFLRRFIQISIILSKTKINIKIAYYLFICNISCCHCYWIRWTNCINILKLRFICHKIGLEIVYIASVSTRLGYNHQNMDAWGGFTPPTTQIPEKCILQTKN